MDIPELKQDKNKTYILSPSHLPAVLLLIKMAKEQIFKKKKKRKKKTPRYVAKDIYLSDLSRRKTNSPLQYHINLFYHLIYTASKAAKK